MTAPLTTHPPACQPQVYALGFVSVFDQIMDAMPAQERSEVFSAYLKARCSLPCGQPSPCRSGFVALAAQEATWALAMMWPCRLSSCFCALHLSELCNAVVCMGQACRALIDVRCDNSTTHNYATAVNSACCSLCMSSQHSTANQ
jgi:hypothetical protein